MNNSLFLIRKKYKTLRPAEKKVADYFLNEDYEIKALTIEGLAELTNVSQPTIVRFANRLGLKGFKELKLKLMEDNIINKEKTNIIKDISYPISKEDKLIDIPGKIVGTNIRLLEDMLKNISSFEYKRAVNLISSGKKIVLFAVENSISVALDLQIKLTYMGYDAIFNTDTYMQRIIASNLNTDDVAIGISYSGTSVQTVETLKLSKERKANTIAITNDEDSIINRYADISLCSLVSQYLKGQAIFSRCVQTAIVDMLYAGVMLTKYETTTNILENNQNINSDLQLKNVEKLHEN